MTTDGSVLTRRTAPKEVRRKQLIDATIETIADLGVSGATMAKITQKAGLSMGIVSLHFESKDNLLKSTLICLAEELRDHWSAVQRDPALGPAQKLWGVIGASFDDSIATRDKVRVWFSFFGEARYRAFYREMVSEFDDERAQIMSSLLASLRPEAREDDFDPQALMQSLESMSDGLWLGMMLYPDWLSADDARQRLWEFLSLHFPENFPRGAVASMESIQ